MSVSETESKRTSMIPNPVYGQDLANRNQMTNGGANITPSSNSNRRSLPGIPPTDRDHPDTSENDRKTTSKRGSEPDNSYAVVAKAVTANPTYGRIPADEPKRGGIESDPAYDFPQNQWDSSPSRRYDNRARARAPTTSTFTSENMLYEAAEKRRSYYFDKASSSSSSKRRNDVLILFVLVVLAFVVGGAALGLSIKLLLEDDTCDRTCSPTVQTGALTGAQTDGAPTPSQLLTGPFPLATVTDIIDSNISALWSRFDEMFAIQARQVNALNATLSQRIDNVTKQQGPRGPSGPQGDKGDKGDAGPPGAQGPGFSSCITSTSSCSVARSTAVTCDTSQAPTQGYTTTGIVCLGESGQTMSRLDVEMNGAQVLTYKCTCYLTETVSSKITTVKCRIHVWECKV